jgi:hypothetical protein
LAPNNIELFEAHQIAINYLEKGELFYHIHNQDNYNYQFPIYPLIVTFLYKLVGFSPTIIVLFNIIIKQLSAVLIIIVFLSYAQINFKKVLSILLLLILSFHPLLNLYCYKVHPFALDLFFFCLITCLALRPKSKSSILSLAITLGLSILNRGSFIVFLPILLVANWKFLLHQKSILNLIILLLIITPTSIYIYRNYQIYGSFSFNSTLGQNLWIGSLDDTEGSATDGPNLNYYNYLEKEHWDKILYIGPTQQSKYFIKLWFDKLKDDPKSFVMNYVNKISNFWIFRQDYSSSNLTRSVIILFKTYMFIIFCFLLLSTFSLEMRTKWLLISIMVSLSMFQAFFYVENRHRILLEPQIYLLIFLYISQMLNKKQRSEIQ